MTEGEVRLSLHNTSLGGITEIIQSLALEFKNDHSAQDSRIALASARAFDNFARYDLAQRLFAFGQAKRDTSRFKSSAHRFNVGGFKR
jgi:hypothetical protein